MTDGKAAGEESSDDVVRCLAWINKHMLVPERFRQECAEEMAKLLTEVRAESHRPEIPVLLRRLNSEGSTSSNEWEATALIQVPSLERRHVGGLHFVDLITFHRASAVGRTEEEARERLMDVIRERMSYMGDARVVNAKL